MKMREEGMELKNVRKNELKGANRHEVKSGKYFCRFLLLIFAFNLLVFSGACSKGIDEDVLPSYTDEKLIEKIDESRNPFFRSEDKRETDKLLRELFKRYRGKTSIFIHSLKLTDVRTNNTFSPDSRVRIILYFSGYGAPFFNRIVDGHTEFVVDKNLEVTKDNHRIQVQYEKDRILDNIEIPCAVDDDTYSQKYSDVLEKAIREKVKGGGKKKIVYVTLPNSSLGSTESTSLKIEITLRVIFSDGM